MSIQTEIDRIKSAKSELAKWLSSHKVVLNVNASINDLVDLLDSAATGGTPATTLVPVEVVCGLNTTISKIYTQKGTLTAATGSLTGSSYRCTANSMLVLYGTCGGGSTTQQAYPTVTVDGDMTVETVYYTGSTSSATRPMGVFVIHVGTQGGTVTFTRAVSKNAII